MNRLDFAWLRRTTASCGLLAAFVTSAGAAHAHPDNWMYVWANDATAAKYVPSTTYSHNAIGGAIWIERDAVGVYRVFFSGAELDVYSDRSEGRQVTAYSTTGAYCDVDQGMFPAEVHCFDTTGSPLDTRFNLILTAKHDHGHPHRSVSVAAMQPSAASYVPVELFPDADGVTRTGVGRYSVAFDSFWAGGGVAGARNAQVTAERSNTTGAAHHCNVLGWGDLIVNVQCFDASGTPADTAFYAHLEREHTATTDETTVAFAWANDSTSASYSPDPAYVSNPGGGAVTATRTGTGVYSMTFSGFGSIGEGAGHPQVSTYGQSDVRCTVQSWSSQTVHVRCFDPAGAPADTRYSLLFRKRFSTLFTRNMAVASIGNTSASFTLDPADAWNPRGVGTDPGPVHFTRNGVGVYAVTFTGFGALGDDGGVALVASHTNDTPCKVSSWNGDVVYVRCFDLTGSPDDGGFELAYLKPADDIATLGYVYKSSPSAASEIANAFYAHNPSGGQITTTKLGTGLYRVTFTGISAYGHNEGVPLVTGYGASSDRCQLVYWAGDQVDVACFSGTGAAQDSQFVLAWFKPDESTDGVAAGLADLPFEPFYFMLGSKSHYPSPWVDGVVYRDDAGEYEVNWGDMRDMGLEKYWLVSTVGTTAVHCLRYKYLSRLNAYCSGTDTQFAGVVLATTRLPEPGYAAQWGAGAAFLLWLVRRKSGGRAQPSAGRFLASARTLATPRR